MGAEGAGPDGGKTLRKPLGMRIRKDFRCLLLEFLAGEIVFCCVLLPDDFHVRSCWWGSRGRHCQGSPSPRSYLRTPRSPGHFACPLRAGPAVLVSCGLSGWAAVASPSLDPVGSDHRAPSPLRCGRAGSFKIQAAGSRYKGKRGTFQAPMGLALRPYPGHVHSGGQLKVMPAPRSATSALFAQRALGI